MDTVKVKAIMHYVFPYTHGFWETMDGYASNDWPTFWAELEKSYPDTSSATRFTMDGLRDFIFESMQQRIWDEEDVMSYRCNFLRRHDQLPQSQQLTAQERSAMFFKGFYHKDQEILLQQLYTKQLNHDLTNPYDLEDVYKVARGYFSNTQFYRPP